MKKNHSGTGPEADAKGQFAKSQADRKSSGVHIAKPTVFTGSEDATANRIPPGTKRVSNDWDPNFDPADASKER